MKLYNPFTKKLEPLLAAGDAPDREITVYVCGITPYDTTHLGHAFTYASADILIRYLEYRGHPVKYVQNVTDIDDDILKRANQTGDDWKALGDRWTRHFIEDMRVLNVRPPEHYPRATEVVPEIVETVGRLIESGVAYEAGGSVYYDVNAWEDFGALCGAPKPQLLELANERGNVPDDPNKRDPLDFVLWQAAKPGEPTWDSPWGAGRPGWHIECSIMSSKYLGDTIDIHSGGSDLLFPHHCCEIAQMEPLTGKEFVRFWMHAAMVRYEGEKMSKSLGNLVWARKLLETYTPDALRLYIAMHQYMIEWSFDEGQLRWAQKLANRWQTAAAGVGGDGPSMNYAQWVATFNAAMDNNVDSPTAISVIDEFAVEILVAARSGWEVSGAQDTLRALAKVLGMVLDGEPEPRVTAGWGKHIQKFGG